MDPIWVSIIGGDELPSGRELPTGRHEAGAKPDVGPLMDRRLADPLGARGHLYRHGPDRLSIRASASRINFDVFDLDQ
jgi:hypothetical protein